MEIFAITERLILRELLPADVDGLFALDSDPEVHRYLGNNPISTKEEAASVIDFIRRQYWENGIGRWAIIDKHTNDFIGWAGLKLMKEETNGHINYYDLGYRLRKEYWGKGIATEAAKASLAYAFEVLKTPVVYAIADVGNAGSDKVLRKSGLRFIETFELDGVPHHWYRIDKEDFKEA